MKYKKIIVKIGTNVITRENGLLDTKRMGGIASQIAELKQAGAEVVVVSSGAVGAGRGLISLRADLNEVAKRQVLAAVGQPELIHQYFQLFKEHGITCAQVLATKEDFRDRGHYLNMRNCFEALLKEKIVPIVNENDVVSVDERMFTDNDEFAGLIATMLNAEAVVILSSVDGVQAKNKNGQLETLPQVKTFKEVEAHLTAEKSSLGRGGMLTKCRMAEKLSKLGITTWIVSGFREGSLKQAALGQTIGTQFFARPKKLSNLKKWVAHTEGQEKGSVTVNEGAEKMLKSKEKAVSLLPVGITDVTGNFEKGDIIKILSEKGASIGYGVAQYNAEKALEFKGKKGKKELIHYNSLFIQE